MSETDKQQPDTQLATSEPEPAPAQEPAPAKPRARSRAWMIWLVLVLLGVVAAYFAWQTWIAAAGELHAAQDERKQLSARVDALGRTAEQARRAADSLRARLDDATKVNQSLREQLLGFGERARLLEDAVANLADKRLSGHDALLLNEAEMLLALGAERYRLFHDVRATIEAYRLADTALAAVDDTAFSTVRQSISSEIDALSALAQADTAATLATLGALRAAAARLPAPAHGLAADGPGASRWARLLGQFIRVRHGEDVAAIVQRHDIVLARQMFVLDLRDAEAALLARDAGRWHAALADATAVLAADFAADAAPVRSAQKRLADLSALALAPPPPDNLGAALRELRNLRATHALRNPAPAPDAAAKPSGEGQ